jgi:S-adenosylmethionine/arginine decarboxylase-like enzyme
MFIMSVQTTADKHKEEAISHLNQAMNELSEIVYGNCWGCDDYANEYQDELADALLMIRKATSKIKK